MGGRHQCIAAAGTPRFVRAKLNELRAHGLIDLEHGVYRASRITLYGICQLPAPPIRH